MLHIVYILFLYIQAQAQIYKHNLLSSFFVVFFLYAVSELSTKFWTTSKEAHPQERLILFSAIILSLPAVLCVCVGGTHWKSPPSTLACSWISHCVSWCMSLLHIVLLFLLLCAVLLLHILFLQPFLQDAVSQQPSWYSASTIFLSPLPWQPLSHRCRTVRMMYSHWVWAPHPGWFLHCVQLRFSMMLSVCDKEVCFDDGW